MEQSGGQVRLSTAPGHGARFELLLPFTAEPETAPVEPADREEVMEGGSEKILVVEDDAAVLALTVDLLKGLGYDVSTASTVSQALAVLRADPSIDLLFSDVIMPGGASGIELARTARRERGDLRILLTSGFIGDRSVLEAGDDPILDKPYARPVLAAKLRSLFAEGTPQTHRARRKLPTDASSAPRGEAGL